MNWILAGILTIVFSNIYYLILRIAQQKGIDAKYYMVANYSIPTLLFYILGKAQGISFVISLHWFIIIALVSIFLSYIGGLISYWGISEAPNAGYSVIIQKSYAIFTSIASIFLFAAPLPLWKFGAIILIIFSAAIVMGLGDTKSKKSNSIRWIVWSIVAFFCFGALRLAGKYIITGGVPLLVELFYVQIIVTGISVLVLIKDHKKNPIKWSPSTLSILIAIGVSVSGFYYFLQTADINAPNLGYSSAMNVAANAFYTVLVAKLLHDEFSKRRFLGVLGVCAGVILLLL